MITGSDPFLEAALQRAVSRLEIARGNAGSESPAIDAGLLDTRLEFLRDRFELSQMCLLILRTCFLFSVDPLFRLRSQLIVLGERREGWSYEDFALMLIESTDSITQLDISLAEESPLRWWRLIESVAREDGCFVIAAPVRSYLLGISPPHWMSHTHAAKPERIAQIDRELLEHEHAATLQRIALLWKEGRPQGAVFVGADSDMLVDFGTTLAAQAQLSAARLDAPYLHGTDRAEFESAFVTALAAARLSSSLLIINHAERLTSASAQNLIEWIARRLHIAAVPCLFCTTSGIPVELFLSSPIELEFSLPETRQRVEYWKTALADCESVSAEEIDILVGGFRLSRGQVERAVKRAAASSVTLGLASLAEACRIESHARLGKNARRVRLRFTWEDLIVPHDVREQLAELSAQMRLRHKILGEWGYAAGQVAEEGVHALFSGAAGTGKTMAAAILARDLHLDLYKINLASVVSKYVGETEKHLDQILDEAERSNAILFFDEADALFGKRSEVKDAQDRYANIEVAYLLQRIEEYSGLTLLASNLAANLDEAFRRRMHYIIEFPPPGEVEREMIWRRAITAATPCEALDFEYLARTLQISGAEIKNIATRAAYFCAQNGAPLTMQLLLQSARREFQKSGRSFLDVDFSEYMQSPKS